MEYSEKYWKEKLKENGLRATFPRLAVIKVLSETTKHPNADSIMAKLKEDKNTEELPLSSVYNALKDLSEKNLILKLTDDKDVMRFDINTNFHIHVIDNKDTIYDLYDEALGEELKEKLKKEINEEIQNIALNIHV